MQDQFWRFLPWQLEIQEWIHNLMAERGRKREPGFEVAKKEGKPPHAMSRPPSWQTPVGTKPSETRNQKQRYKTDQQKEQRRLKRHKGRQTRLQDREAGAVQKRVKELVAKRERNAVSGQKLHKRIPLERKLFALLPMPDMGAKFLQMNTDVLRVFPLSLRAPPLKPLQCGYH